MSMTDTISYIKESLNSFYPPEEVNSFVRIIMRQVCHLEPHRLLIDKDNYLSEAEKEKIKAIVERLSKHEPIQYILGTAEFCGYSFNVNPSVLIPRPETEELVERIYNNEKGREVRLLDIGTGSGCIAISLAKMLTDAKVFAVDISKEALIVAKRNAEENSAPVSFNEIDILSVSDDTSFLQEKLDVIVSNPPYVLHEEKAAMKKNVLEYEPHTALFVPDNDPLLFYRKIAQLGTKYMNPGGRLYFEINAMYGQMTIDLLKNTGYFNITLISDLSGRDRMIEAILK
jgi:protein-(glutamine-N5) methyltransferase, release factor-specific